MESVTIMLGKIIMVVNKLRNKMHQYTIFKGKLIGNFEGQAYKKATH